MLKQLNKLLSATDTFIAYGYGRARNECHIVEEKDLDAIAFSIKDEDSFDIVFTFRELMEAKIDSHGNLTVAGYEIKCLRYSQIDVLEMLERVD